MPICDRKIVSIHYNKQLDICYAILEPNDGEPGQYQQNFSIELFFGWYTLLSQRAGFEGKAIVTDQTGQITNWYLVDSLTVSQIDNGSGINIQLTSQSTTDSVTIPFDGTEVAIQKSPDDTYKIYLNASQPPFVTSVDFETFDSNGASVETGSLPWVEGTVSQTLNPSILPFVKIVFTIQTSPGIAISNTGVGTTWSVTPMTADQTTAEGLTVLMANNAAAGTTRKPDGQKWKVSVSIASVAAATVIQFVTRLAGVTVQTINAITLKTAGQMTVTITNNAYDEIILKVDPI